MQSFHPRRARRPFRLLALCLTALAPALLAGCGGGGSSNTSEGFRFVPEGSGPVIPYQNVHFEYDPGSVGTGVVVSAAPLAASGVPQPLPPGENGPVAAVNTVGQPQIAAYAIHLSASSLAFSSRPRIYLTYAPGTAFTNSTPRIFLYDPTQSAWQVLPLSATGPAPAANTLEALLPTTLNSGDVLAIFADAVPAPPTTQPTF